MRDYSINISMTKLSLSFLLATALALLTACTDATTTTAAATAAPAAAGIALGTSTNFILTDNATAATLTATLVDSSNAVMPGVAISFSTTSGSLNASSATTDVNGQAIVTLKSGLADPSNRTATVTATLGGLTASIPILIKGSTVTMTLSSNTVQVGAGTLTASATATKAGGLGVSYQSIRFSTSTPDTGAAMLSVATLPSVTVPPATCTLTQAATCNLTTDVSGVVGPLTLTPTAAGTVVLKAEWLDSAGAVTATTTQNISVTAAAGIAFAITIPVANPIALSSGVTQALAVSVPATISGIAVASVRLSASAGTWTGTAPATGPLTSIMQTPAAGAVAAIYTAPYNSGSATIQVDALGTVGGVPLSTLSSLSRTFVISAPSSAAAKLFLAPTVSTIVPSSGSNISTSTLEVTVRDANLNAVGGAAVMFGLLGTTGSGESVSPAVAITDSLGKATTTFSAGSAPTLAAIYAQARVVGQTCTFVPSPPVTETNPMCDQAPLIVSAKAVSVTVGFGTGIVDTANSTQYQLPGSVLVVDANNSPVPGAIVTLSAFPIEYRNGTITAVQDLSVSGTTTVWQCGGPFDTRTLYTWVNKFGTTVTGYYTTTFTPAEDANRNGILDPGEDTLGNGILDHAEDLNGNKIIDPGEDVNGNSILDIEEDANGNGILDPGEDSIPAVTSKNWAMAIANNGVLSPPQAAGGTVTLTVTTDCTGSATFYLQYPKSSAWFINDEVTARVVVSGTESSAKTTLTLPMSVGDQFNPVCTIGHTSTY